MTVQSHTDATRFPALTYPPTRRDDVVDDYHGTLVADPYRWLEHVDADATAAWVRAQNELTESFLAAVPERERIRARLRHVWDYERRSVPRREGREYVFFRNAGLQSQAVMYAAPAPDGDARVLLDPNAFSLDGTVALADVAFTADGARFAYAVTASGSDWLEWHVRETATATDLPDVVRWAKFSGAAWLPDGSGFYYSRYDEPAGDELKAANYDHKVYLHRLGTPQSDDSLIYARPDHKDWNFHPHVTEDGRWLVLHVRRGTDPENRVYVRDLAAGADAPVEALLDAGDADYDFVGNDGERFYFTTSLDAPRGRLIAIDRGVPAPLEIVGQAEDALSSVSLFGDRVVALYLHDAHTQVRTFLLDGSPAGDIALPGLGSAAGFEGKRSARETFFSFTSYTSPTAIYRYDLESSAVTPVFVPAVAFDPGAYASEQRFFASKDGTRIPITISCKRGTPRDGSAPTILYGYGGFEVSLTPAFSTAMLVWMEMGGVYAVVNARGGGEYGQAWHLAGTRERKQNVFDDFIAAAEFLIAEGYTSTPKLAIAGGSNGGLLVAAAMTQRPDLFGAVLPAVGVMDMLRYQHFTIGWAWASDYGTADHADEFAWLYAYSPLHTVVDGVSYPPTFITTADHDDRVFPAHSFKFAARLQAAQGGDAPILIRIESKAGHGSGKPTGKLIDENADRYAFLVHVLDMRLPLGQ